MLTVGLPRAMAYYYMYPFFAEFCEQLGVKPVLSPETTNTTLEKMEFCPTDEPCVAVKLLFAHVRELLDQGVQQLFIPSLVSLEARNFCCPKFIGIPYMVQNILQNGVEVISPHIDLSKPRNHWEDSWFDAGVKLGASPREAKLALQAAWQAQEQFSKICVSHQVTTPEAYQLYHENNFRTKDAAPKQTTGQKIAVIGHPYILYDNFSLDLVSRFAKYGPVLTAEMAPASEVKKQVDSVKDGNKMWSFEAHLLGAAFYYMRAGLIDKLVLIGSFECGPESIIEDYIEEEAIRLGVPFLLLTMDEHTADAGLATRIEAFMDVHPLPADELQAERENTNKQTTPSHPVARETNMVVGMPTMGHLDLALRSVLNTCGVEAKLPPPATKEILELGKPLVPEFVCIPFTYTLGQMRWLLENGATHLLMVGGKGKCRLGWYAQVQEQMLRRLGYDFELLVVDSPFPLGEQWPDFQNTLKKITNNTSWPTIARSLYTGYQKMSAVDEAERICHKLRAFERDQGTINKFFDSFVLKLEKADSSKKVTQLFRHFTEKADAIDTEETNPVRVRIVGEIWVTLEPYANLHLEKLLGESENPRVWVDREISVTQWFHKNIIPTRNVSNRKKEVQRAANPYLGADIGGHGQYSVGLTALAPEENIDGVIHIMPFTCMPEIVAQNIMTTVSNKLDLPILTYIITDQTGEAGIETRIEAFLDILQDRRKS